MSENRNAEVIMEMMEQQALIEDKAWTMFKEAYEREVPPPILEEKPEKQNHWIYRVMLLGLVGALIVSGLQTIPAFYIVMEQAGLPIPLAIMGGISAFVAVDLVMFSASHYLVQTQWRLRSKTNEENFNRIERFIQVAQWFGFAVSIGSNFYFVFFAYHVNNYIAGIDTGITLTVAVLIALAPAIQGLAIGSVIAALPITDEIESIRINRRNRELMQSYNKAMRSSWDSRKRKYGVKDMSERIERLQDMSEPVQMSNGHGRTSTQGFNAMSDVSIQVRDYLLANPDAMNKSVRELADLIGVGKSTVANVRKDMMENGEL